MLLLVLLLVLPLVFIHVFILMPRYCPAGWLVLKTVAQQPHSSSSTREALEKCKETGGRNLKTLKSERTKKSGRVLKESPVQCTSYLTTHRKAKDKYLYVS